MRLLLERALIRGLRFGAGWLELGESNVSCGISRRQQTRLLIGMTFDVGVARLILKEGISVQGGVRVSC
jgi:hypothetical protein